METPPSRKVGGTGWGASFPTNHRWKSPVGMEATWLWNDITLVSV